MKLICRLILIGILCTNCKVHPRLDSIEYIDFSWSFWDAKTGNKVPLFFKCRMYSYITKNGETGVFVYNNRNPIRLGYHKGQIASEVIEDFESFSHQTAKDVVDSLYSEFKGVPSDPNKPPPIYDGTYLKVRVNYDNGSSKLYNFVNDEFSLTYKPLSDLQNQILNIVQRNENLLIEDINVFDSNKFAFIKDAFMEDMKFGFHFEIPTRVLKNDTIVDLSEITNY